jgi:hypothetical protein
MSGNSKELNSGNAAVEEYRLEMWRRKNLYEEHLR